MCGIVGYIGPRDAAGVVLDGLQRLEYRGYDSAGIAARNGEPRMVTVRRAGRLKELIEALDRQPLHGGLALGHTRWATHGPPVERNAHPHATEDGRLVVIHNGIIENYLELKRRLEAAGHAFVSDTDSEVMAHLVESHYRGDLTAAVREALAEVHGAFAFVVAHAEHDALVAARRTSPMVLGVSEGEALVASDVPALLPYTRRVVHLEDGDVATLRTAGIDVTDVDGTPVTRPERTIDWKPEDAERGGYPHFMLKEIFEQPRVLRDTLGGRIAADDTDVQLDLSLDPRAIDRVVVVACGTAYYAGQVGEALLERLARVPVEVEIASEFRYREPVVDARTLVVAVSQSGETLDTLEALREAKRLGARTLSVLNVKGSSLARECDDVLYIHAGPEIGVASTKAYLAMLAAFALLAVFVGRRRGALDEDAARTFLRALREAPGRVEAALADRDAVRAVARRFAERQHFLFLGRGMNVPTAFEGALKLKEISYVHAEGYATGEMKHGPIALIDATMPVLVVATDAERLDKTLSNLQEIRARDGTAIALANPDDERVTPHADVLLPAPHTIELLSPLVNAVPLQLLAYETAVALGRDVDKPRNLAKSVTVE